MRTPRQRRANNFAGFKLLVLGLWLGAIWFAGPPSAHLVWAVAALNLWPWRPDWRR